MQLKKRARRFTKQYMLSFPGFRICDRCNKLVYQGCKRCGGGK